MNMKNVGIIAEYNPLHNGHLYQMNKINGNIIVALSGNFTERGDVAMLNKYSRAKEAVMHGASMVVEIPVFGVLSCAEHYAQCAVNTLDSLDIVDSICFGSESGNIDTLKRIADMEENSDTKTIFDELLSNGMAYPKALTTALASTSNIRGVEKILSQPNNILGIEYIRACKNTSIEPTTIARVGSGYNDTTIEHGMFASASSIRANLNDESISEYLPRNVLESIRDSRVNIDALQSMLYELLVVKEQNIENILGISEGLDNRVRNVLESCPSYNELLASIKTKRYTMARIKRTLLAILIGIEKRHADLIDNIDYVTVLAIKRNYLPMLGKCKAHVITKYNDYAKTNHPYATLDKRADRLYNGIASDKITSHQMLIID